MRSHLGARAVVARRSFSGIASTDARKNRSTVVAWHPLSSKKPNKIDTLHPERGPIIRRPYFHCQED
jgi:hypothetical protein